MFDQLALLNASQTTWKVKVRVTRMWPAGKEGIKGYNLILLDDDNSHVHAFVYPDKWKSIANMMVEGGLYILSNFYAKEAFGSLRPVSSNILINFSPATMVEKIEEDDFMIPAHKFEFVDLGDLFKVVSGYADVESPDYSTDVIGALEDFKNVTDINTKNGERKIAKFRITDGRHSHIVSVWGDLAVTTDANYKDIMKKSMKKTKKKPVIIVIVSSTKLQIFRNSVQISTLPSSKVYLNLDNDIAIAMRQRLDDEGYVAPDEEVLASPSEHVTVTASTPTPVIETLTLKQLSEKTSTDFRESYFLCKVMVKAVEENDNWWYFSCPNTKCNEEIIKVEGKIRCPKCQKNLPVAEKRYRIVILAEDATEAYNFVLLDRAVRRIVGKTVTKLIADSIENASSKDYPPKIKEIAGKEMTLKIQLNDDNILLHSTVFFAHDAYDITPSSTSKSETIMTGFTNSSIGENNVVDIAEGENTPASAKSVAKAYAKSSTKKIKTEK